MVDQPTSPFEQIRSFEWDEEKRATNLVKHGIDFFDVHRIFEEDVVLVPSDRGIERRYAVFGNLDREVIVAICAIRTGSCRWISARRASRNERKKYHDNIERRSARRQD
jgi:uncharacterized DUF497 family protein